MLRTIAWFLTVMISWQSILSGQQIYVSMTGNDNNPGTKERPVASLSTAISRAREYRKTSVVSAPLEIIIEAGEYFMIQPLELNENDSGTENCPLVIRAESGSKVVLRGGIEVTGFERINNMLWRAFIPQVAWYDSYFEQLYVNGKRAVRARSPNTGFYKVRSVTETVLEKGSGRAPELAVQKIELDSTGYGCLKNFTGQDLEDALIVFYHNWDNTRKRIAGFSSDSSFVFITGEGMKPWNPINNKSRYLIENYRGALDAPGEWFLDRNGYLYYIPWEGQTIENTTFHIPVIKEFLSIHGNCSTGKMVANIRFENLAFEVAGYRTPPNGNEPAQAAAPAGAVITLDFAENIGFRNCEVSHTGTYAMWFRRAVSNCTVSQCFLHDLGAGGIKIGETIIRPEASEITNNITIDNNIITDAGHIFPCAVGIIIFNARDNRLTHNEISNLRYSGISVGWVWGYAQSPSKRNLIAYNHIHHLGWGELCDMGGVYTLGASEGTVVANNVIHHVYSFDYGGWGLYTDEGSYGITMENNLVYRCKNSGFHQHYGRENIIRNNIFAFNIRAQLQATRIEEHTSLSFLNNIVFFDKGTLFSSNWHKFNLISDYNCYWDRRSPEIRFGEGSFSEWKKSGRDIHSIIADPMFVNPDKYDFRFKSLSVVKKIKFKPFDYSEAGVYGSEEWKRKAAFDQELAKKFDNIVKNFELNRKN